jgi:aminobenzoyl-glutamate utilization protein B
MIAAAKIMACTGVDLLTKPELLESAKKDWVENLEGETYPNPLPADVKPAIW